MGKVMNIRQAKIMSLGVVASFLVIHILLLIVFYKCGVTPMVYFNIGSVICYALMPIVIMKGWLRTFCVATYLEVVAHMFTAVYFTGWENGFQVTLIGIGILVSYSEYTGRYLKIPYIHSAPMSVVGMAAYIVSCIIAHHQPTPYPLPEDVSYLFCLAWGVVTFSITLTFLYIFVKVSSDTEELLANELDHDQLTGLPNRYNLWDHLNKLDHDGRLEGSWIAMVDIDDFKYINDTYGHNCGDQILCGLATLLQGNDHSWHPCRWGGEEFLLTGDTRGDFDARAKELDEFRKRVAKHTFNTEETALKLTITIGATVYDPRLTLRDWIGEADRKLYEGKRSGKNIVVA